MTGKLDRTIHLQPGPFAAQAEDVKPPIVSTPTEATPTLPWHADLLRRFAHYSNVVAVIPLVGLTPSWDLPPFLLSMEAGSSLWMVKERCLCAIRRGWMQELGYRLGTIGLRSSRGEADWYCDEYGRGFDGSQLLLPVIFLTMPLEAEPSF